jgi:hypothetical protein
MVTSPLNKFQLVLLSFMLSTCGSHELVTRLYPVINTTGVTDITFNGVTFNGEILNVGNSGISDHGFVFSLLSDPILGNADQISLGTASAGKFNASTNRDLESGNVYHVRAYAITKLNGITVYGQEVSFQFIY